MYIKCTNSVNTLGSMKGEIMIVLDYSDKRPLYEQVVERFKELISRGILAADEQMPSVRYLAVELSINPNTIQRAYSELERLGFIYPVKGRGNFVADVSRLLEGRQKEYFAKLDEVLKKAQDLSLGYQDIVEHVNKYFDK